MRSLLHIHRVVDPVKVYLFGLRILLSAILTEMVRTYTSYREPKVRVYNVVNTAVH